jgi:hypothetical protein
MADPQNPQDQSETPKLVRWYVGITLFAVIFWQAWTSLAALVQVPIYMGMFHDLGGELPAITKALEKTYRFFWVAPLACAVPAVILLRRRTIRPLPAALLLILLFVMGFALKIVLSEGVSAPMRQMLEGVREFSKSSGQ